MNFKKTLFLIAIVLIVFMGCKKNEVAADPANGSGTMSASIDGVNWKAVKITLAKWISGQLHIQGEASDGSMIQISLLSIDQAGTYHVGGISSVNLAAYNLTEDSAWLTNVLIPEGTVNVTNLSSSGTKGTFSFIGSNMVTEKNITNGEFNITF